MRNEKMRLILEMIAGVDMPRSAYEDKPWMVTSAAWWKFLTVDACHFMGLSMLWIMGDLIDAGIRHLFSRLKHVADIGHNLHLLTMS